MKEEEKILKAAVGGVDCPPVEELLAALDGSLATDAAAEIKNHLESCAACQAEAHLFEDFQAGQVRPGEREDVDWVVAELRGRGARGEDSAPRPRVLRWPRRLRVAAGGWKLPAAIAAMALLGVVMLQWPIGNGVAPTLPSPSGMVRSGTLELLEPRGEQTEVPQLWRWQPAPGAQSYLIRFLEVDGSEVATIRTSLAEVETPEAIAQLLGSGRQVQWQVLARDVEDVTVNSSPVQPVFLRREPR